MPWTLRRRPRTVDSSTPSGTRTASAVRSSSPSGARRSSPSTASASRSASWARRWRSQRVGSHSSRTRRSASWRARTRLTGGTWWYVRPRPPSVHCASRPTRSKYDERPGRMRRSSLRSARSPAVSGARPGGAPRQAWLTANATSTCASSIRSAWPPSDVAQSTSSSASCSRQAAPSPSRGCAHPGRALAVHDGERAAAAVHRRDEPSGFQRPPELALDADHLGAGAGQRAREPLAEHARDAADDPVAGVDEVHDRRLHPGAAGAGQRQRGAAVRGERLAQEDLRLVHDRGEGRVHRARRHLAQACAHALGQGAGTGAEQQRLGRGHGASTSGKCSARWERSVSRTKRRSSCEATR